MLQHLVRHGVLAVCIDQGRHTFFETEWWRIGEIATAFMEFVLDSGDKGNPCRAIPVPLDPIPRMLLHNTLDGGFGSSAARDAGPSDVKYDVLCAARRRRNPSLYFPSEPHSLRLERARSLRSTATMEGIKS